MSREFMLGTHRVWISDIHCTETYGEYIQYSDVNRINDKLVRRARSGRMEPLWGNLPILLLDPYVATPRLLVALSDEARSKYLPKWLVYARLESDWVRDPNEYHSHLYVGFFAKDIFGLPIGDLIASRVSGLDWEDFAQDYTD